ncbi:hypothetical protein A4X09_0g588 [Tilletia walkeri]|uniref:DNA damage-binding protein CMR1 n=1 Tax=Tilletia walkeri TaxID=117179 RepID=A0A8X7T7W9_9BASI|nr:hypothetical protein A4X09_0g588 [Tilletia walkeri]
MPELSSYEQQRLENIRRNEELMRELNLLNGASTLAIDPETTRRAAAAAASSSSSSTKRAAKPKITPAEAQARKELAEQRKKDRENARPTRVQPPRRSSARLAGIEADSEALKRKYDEVAETERAEREAAKKARHEDRDLQRLTGGGLSEEEVLALRSAFTGLGGGLASSTNGDEGDDDTKRTPRSSGRTTGGKGKGKAESSFELAELKEELNKMELRAVAKVVRARIYSMAFHPTLDKDLIFAGDKEGAIGIWEPWAATDDIATDAGDDADGVDSSKASGKSWSLQAHGKDSVTCLRFDPVDAQSVYSSSYDSTIRQLSLSGGGGTSNGASAQSDVLHSTEIWAGNQDVLLSIFDVLAPQTHPDVFTHTPAPGLDERSIWIADHRGGLIHVDVRERPRIGGAETSSSSGKGGGRGARAGHQGSSSSATSRRWQIHEKKIGGLAVNPLFPYAIATAGLDQHVRLFDVRALEALPVTMDAPYNATAVDQETLQMVQGSAMRASCRARLACTSVDWSPRGDQLAAVSYDDVVKVWDVNGPGLRAGFEDDDSTENGSAVTPSKATSNGGRKSQRVKKEEGEGGQQSMFRYFKQEPKTEELGSLSPSQVDQKKKKAPSFPSSSTLLSRLGSHNVLEKPTHTLPHNNQTGKWLTMFRVRWCANPSVDPHFSMGSMHRHAEIWSGRTGELLRSLYDEDWVTAVPAVTAMHPRRVGRLVAGNASGKCHLWCPPE